MILLFGSTGFVGTSVHEYLTTRGKDVTRVTRNDYDMTRPDNLSKLQKYDDVDTVIWCSGFNQNDRMGHLTHSTYDDIMNVNINAVTKSMDYLLYHKKIKKGARMCIISSILEEKGRVNKLSYCVSKSALGGLVRASSITLYEDDILVNSILPGPIDNEMTKNTLSKEEYLKMEPYFVDMSDICKMCYLLCFENTSITGQSIKIDNGLTSKIIYA